MSNSRAQRNRKPVNYSKFALGNDDDDDFENVTPPVNKKSKSEKTKKGKSTVVASNKKISLNQEIKNIEETSTKLSLDAADQNTTVVKTKRGLAARKSPQDRVFERELELVLEISKTSQSPLKSTPCEVKEDITNKIANHTDVVQENGMRPRRIVEDGEVPSTSRQRTATKRKYVVDDSESESESHDEYECEASEAESESDFDPDSDDSDFKVKPIKTTAKTSTKRDSNKKGANQTVNVKAKQKAVIKRPSTTNETTRNGNTPNPSVVIKKANITNLQPSRLIPTDHTDVDDNICKQLPESVAVSSASTERCNVSTVNDVNYTSTALKPAATSPACTSAVLRVANKPALTSPACTSAKPRVASKPVKSQCPTTPKNVGLTNSACRSQFVSPSSAECSARSPLGGVQLKSPSSGGLRLGLSRHSRVKSLHANVRLPP